MSQARRWGDATALGRGRQSRGTRRQPRATRPLGLVLSALRPLLRRALLPPSPPSPRPAPWLGALGLPPLSRAALPDGADNRPSRPPPDGGTGHIAARREGGVGGRAEGRGGGGGGGRAGCGKGGSGPALGAGRGRSFCCPAEEGEPREGERRVPGDGGGRGRGGLLRRGAFRHRSRAPFICGSSLLAGCCVCGSRPGVEGESQKLALPQAEPLASPEGWEGRGLQRGRPCVSCFVSPTAFWL